VVFKPLDEKTYLRYLKTVGWSLKKGSIDYKLYDDKDQFVCAIKISHGRKTKEEVVAMSVQITAREFKERGLVWPPRKK
jgi:hypothetical protein